MRRKVAILMWILGAIVIVVFGVYAGGARKASTASSHRGTTPKIASFADVTEVLDGDTIVLADGEHVRYIGVNAPEISHNGKPADCYGVEAGRLNRALLEGQHVLLIPEQTNRDKYGRLLRHVFVHGVSVEVELLRAGAARTLTIPPNNGSASRFLTLEKAAKEARRGLWGACIPP